MNPSRILIVYGTSYGQTAKIAARIGKTLTSIGHQVTLADAKALPAGLSVKAFDGVIAGASVIVGGHQKSVERFVRDHLETLNGIPSAFYSVTASAGSVHNQSRTAALLLLDRFLHRVGWHPQLSASIAGAINYPRYGFLLRWYMKRASQKNGGSTDTSREHEYTDWSQVERFAGRFAELLPAKDLEASLNVGAVNADQPYRVEAI